MTTFDNWLDAVGFTNTIALGYVLHYCRVGPYVPIVIQLRELDYMIRDRQHALNMTRYLYKIPGEQNL